MPLGGALVAGGMVAANVAGALIGQNAARKDREAAEAASRAALDELNKVGVPDIEAQKILLQHPQLVFKYAPELEEVYILEQSRVAQLQEDPRLRSAQMSALEKMQAIGEEGFTPEEMAELRNVRRAVAQEEQARQGAILQNMAARGMAGGGQELAARAISSQQAAQRASEESDRLSAEAYKRALLGISQGSEMAGDIRGQDFGIESDKARAADEIARFNVGNRQDVQQRNIGSKNQAALRKAELKQELENTRAGLANQQEIYNKELLQQKFENDLRLAQAKSGAQTGQSNFYAGQGASKAAMWQGIGSGASQAIGTGAAYSANSKANEKKV